jgi:hypothetical protein
MECRIQLTWTWTVLLSQVHSRQSDLGLGPVFIVSSKYNYVDFVPYVTDSQVRFASQKPRVKHSSIYPIHYITTVLTVIEINTSLKNLTKLSL